MDIREWLPHKDSSKTFCVPRVYRTNALWFYIANTHTACKYSPLLIWSIKVKSFRLKLHQDPELFTRLPPTLLVPSSFSHLKRSWKVLVKVREPAFASPSLSLSRLLPLLMPLLDYFLNLLAKDPCGCRQCLLTTWLSWFPFDLNYLWFSRSECVFGEHLSLSALYIGNLLLYSTIFSSFEIKFAKFSVENNSLHFNAAEVGYFHAVSKERWIYVQININESSRTDDDVGNDKKSCFSSPSCGFYPQVRHLSWEFIG